MNNKGQIPTPNVDFTLWQSHLLSLYCCRYWISDDPQSYPSFPSFVFGTPCPRRAVRMTRISLVLLQLLRSLSSLGGETSSFFIHPSSTATRTTTTATTTKALSQLQGRGRLFHSVRTTFVQQQRPTHIMSLPDAAASASTSAAVHFPPIVAPLHHRLTVNNNEIDIENDNEHVEEPNQPWRFEEACQEAIERKVPLFLSQDVVLSQTIHLKGQQSLHIVGSRHQYHDGTPPQLQLQPQSQQERITITGALPSLFLLNNKNQLIIENVNLDHTLQTDDHKEVGAAINMRGKSKVVLKHSQVTSLSGFCVWAIQNSKVLLQDCRFMATTRSAIVCFGQTTCELYNCHVDQAGVHGLCARGTCQISLVDCVITQSAARGIYVYANASLMLQGCHVWGTLHPDKAAVEVSSMGCPTTSPTTMSAKGSKTSSSLVLKDCQIVDNQGAGVRIRGPIIHEEQGRNVVERNVKGNWDIILEHSEDNGVEASSANLAQGRDDIHHSTKTNTTTGLLPPLRRDAKGSSFRRGDWLCSKCFQIVAAGRATGQMVMEERCSNCSLLRGSPDEDRLLTMNEILECNMGIDIRQGWTLPLPNDEGSAAANIVWEFDGDDAKGWISYDATSSSFLEQAYTNMMNQEQADNMDVGHNSSQQVVPEGSHQLVNLQGRKYQVNLRTMVQINTKTQFPRYVRRRTTVSQRSPS